MGEFETENLAGDFLEVSRLRIRPLFLVSRRESTGRRMAVICNYRLDELVESRFSPVAPTIDKNTICSGGDLLVRRCRCFQRLQSREDVDEWDDMH